ncbi:MAG TPA: PAS domain S-box protein, partial [Verrucomicrobiae bacterium]
MIRWPPRPHSIRQKLVLLIWLVAAAALVLVSVALLIYEYTRFRGTSVRDLTTQADIIAAAVVTPLVFDNRKESTKTLAAALEARPDVLWAAVYNKAGQRFAVYRGLSDTGREIPLLAPPPDHRFIGGELEVVQPILSGEDREGILLLHVHLREQRARLINYALILGLLTLVALLGAFALGARLQGVVTDPLFELIQTAESVGFEKNYTVRARKRSDDELGRLVDEFNEMLAQIQHRDEALGASEMRFRQLAEAIDQVFWMMDLVTPKVLYVSPAYERIWGRPAAMLEADPMAWFAAVHPDDRQRVSRSLEVRRQTGVSEAEFRIIRPDGSVRWVRNRAFPVREASGEVRRTAGVVEDITERHRAEEQRDRFFNLSLDLLCMADLNGSFTRVNPAFARTLGFTTEELLRRPFLELALPEDLPVVTAALERLRHG